MQQSASAAEGMRQQAETLVRAVSTFRLTVEERLDEGVTPFALASASQRQPEPPRSTSTAMAQPMAAKPVRKAAPTTAAAGSDDWEEF